MKRKWFVVILIGLGLAVPAIYYANELGLGQNKIESLIKLASKNSTHNV